MTTIDSLDSLDQHVGQQLNRLQRIAVGIGVVGWVLFLIGAVTHHETAFQSYLVGYILWVGITAGCLAALMLHHVVGGGWGFIIRRPLEAAVKMLPWMLLLFIPIALGLSSIYPWAAPDAMSDPILRMRHVYMNPAFFIGRTIFYFVVWMLLAYFLIKWGNTQNVRSDRSVTNRLNVMSAGGLVVYCLTTTFCMIDWVMSTSPHYYSSIIGFLFVASEGLEALATMLILVAFLAANTPGIREVPKRYFRDLGNLLLVFVLLWAYMSFSQYLINYSGNGTREAQWYLSRTTGGWGLITLTLLPFHFALPFLALLSSSLKLDPRKLAKLACWILFMRLVDTFWWIAPSARSHIFITLSDVGAPLGIGGIWLWLWASNLKGKSLYPAHDPRLDPNWSAKEAVEHA